MNYAVGHNTPGYLPESDVWITEDYDSAKQALIEDMDRHADHLAEMGWDAQVGQVVDAIYEMSIADEGVALAAIVPASDSEHDLGVSFWLSETEEAPEV